MIDILKETKSGLVLTKNDNVLKTAVILSFGAVIMTGIVSYHVASSVKEAALIKANKEVEMTKIVKEKEVEIAKINAEVTKETAKINDISTVTQDKLTSCMQTMMNESLKGGKFLSAKEAKEICKDHKINNKI